MLVAYRALRRQSMLSWQCFQNLKVFIISRTNARLKRCQVSFLFESALISLVVLFVAAEEALDDQIVGLKRDAVEFGTFKPVEPTRAGRALDSRALCPAAEAFLWVLVHKCCKSGPDIEPSLLFWVELRYFVFLDAVLVEK